MTVKAFDNTHVTNVNGHDGAKTNHLFKFCNIEEEFVCKQLSKLNAGKATGIDGLSSKLLRAGAIQIAKPLTHIMNLSISTATIPSEWKTAIVTPIYKSGAHSDCSNY